jgi:hypothetical protein
MGKVILIYLIIQLITTAFGLSVIETIRPIVNKKLTRDGYVLMNKNSMYRFNENLSNFAKGLIPCYYLFKALNMVRGSDAIEREAARQVKKGNYVTMEQYLNPVVEVNKEDKNVARIVQETEPFEKEYKHFARKNTYSFLESGAEKVQYQKEYKDDQSQLITPYAEKIVNTVIKEVIKKPTIKDILNAIYGLNPEDIDKLIDLLYQYSEKKKGHPVLKLKDVA